MTGSPRRICVVNSRSGGQVGAALVNTLGALVGAGQVVDLAHRSMDLAVKRALNEADQLIACGGDGTVAWALETVHQQSRAAGVAPVQVGVLPIGTGNDLARWLWAGPPKDPLTDAEHMLAALVDAPWLRLDRWVFEGLGEPRPCYLYCSLGVDARIADHFHSLRQRHGWLFRSALTNKVLYGLIGLASRVKRLPVAWLDRDWEPTPVRSLVWSNIGSYAGGGQLWAGAHSGDGVLECYWFRSATDLSLQVRGPWAIQPHLRVGDVQFRCRRTVTAQIDGEPVHLPPGRYRLRHGGRVPVLAPGFHARTGMMPRPSDRLASIDRPLTDS